MVFGMNLIYQDILTLDVFVSCNIEFYAHYWNRGLSDYPNTKCDMWHWDEVTCEKYGLKHAKGIWQDGFSKHKGVVHLGHSSGFQCPGIAYTEYDCRRLLLLGYDMRYDENYDGKARHIGETPRHYFGEYPPDLQHWPSVQVKNGVHVGLIAQFEKVKEINTDLEIINCSPGSAMTCFPMMSLEEAL